MQKFKTLPDAIALAEFAHRNQVDKAGLPYIEHTKRVLAKVQAQGALPHVQIAAVLHDVTEDTAFTSDILLALGFSEAAVKIVRLLDRDHSEILWYHQPDIDDLITKDDFYYQKIREDVGARLVKLADIEDNLSPWRLVYLEEATQKRLRAKYAKARQILQPGIWTNPNHPYPPT